jgi:hypothetical protein
LIVLHLSRPAHARENMVPDPKHGILKTHGSKSGSRARAAWNEANLAENEHIKAELHATKIDEPKTPYHAPIDDDIGEMSHPDCLLPASFVYSLSYAEVSCRDGAT